MNQIKIEARFRFRVLSYLVKNMHNSKALLPTSHFGLPSLLPFQDLVPSIPIYGPPDKIANMQQTIYVRFKIKTKSNKHYDKMPF